MGRHPALLRLAAAAALAAAWCLVPDPARSWLRLVVVSTGAVALVVGAARRGSNITGMMRAATVGTVLWAVLDVVAILDHLLGLGRVADLTQMGLSVAAASIWAVATFALVPRRDQARMTTLYVDLSIVSSAVITVLWFEFAFPGADVAAQDAGMRLYAGSGVAVYLMWAVTYLVLHGRATRSGHYAAIGAAALVTLGVADLLTHVPFAHPVATRPGLLVGAITVGTWLMLAASALDPEHTLDHWARAAPPARGRDALAFGAVGLTTPLTLIVTRLIGRPIDLTMVWVLVASARFVTMALRSRGLQQQIWVALSTDAQTGLPDGRAVSRAVTVRLRQTSGDRRLALVLIQVARLADVQRMLGTRDGVQLAGQVAAALGTEGDDVARLTPEVFALVVLRDDDEQVREAALRARDRLRLALLDGETPLRLDVAVAVTTVTPGTTGQRALAEAHGALARAAQDAGRLVLAHGEASAPLVGALLVELPAAAATGQLTPDFQGLFAICGRRVVGAEALVRWRHPQHGLLSPALFVPAAEATGIVGSLTRFVLDCALRECAAWRACGDDLRVAVNLSARDVEDPTLPDAVLAALERHGLPSRALELEITETMAMSDELGGTRVLRELTRIGVRLAIDDFGTGYSSVERLQRLPFRTLKIDRTFVTHLATDPTSRTVVRGAVHLAHRLGAQVVAEGVEDEDSLTVLEELGCEFAQGFLLHRPGAAGQITDLARARR